MGHPVVYSMKQPDTTTTRLKPEDTTAVNTDQNQSQIQDNKTMKKNIFEEIMKPKPNDGPEAEPLKPVKPKKKPNLK